MPISATQEREELYRALQQRADYQEIKRAFDEWCAAWFWPADQLVHVPTPATFYTPSKSTSDIVDEMVSELNFFHWELEFPDVFARPEHGFDAILGNPPWDIAKPLSLEFFSDYDPLYRTYGKQEALSEQRHLFQLEPFIEQEWLRYQAYFKSMSNWAKHTASPFGDPAMPNMDTFSLKSGKMGERLHNEWRRRRSQYHGYSDQDHPFRHQGSTASSLNTYRMFLEVAHHLLKKGGQLGMLVPSGIYTDQGTIALRLLFLNHCCWQWLFCFINWQHLFDIDSRFKFVVLLLKKDGFTPQLQVAFNRVALTDLEKPDTIMLKFSRKQIEQFSPKSLAITELQAQRDLEILEKLYSRNTVLFDDQSQRGWQIQYAAEEFHLSKESSLFSPLPNWEAKGYRTDDYGRWVGYDGGIALPLYEGRMIGAFDPSKKGWVSGKGRTAIWHEIPFEGKVLEPQYLIPLETYYKRGKVLRGNKIAFMRVSSATNTRSMYAALVGDMPSGHTVAMLQPAAKDVVSTLSLMACLNSFTYDYALRCRLGGLDLTYSVLSETPLALPHHLRQMSIAEIVARLNLIMPYFASQWMELSTVDPHLTEQNWHKLCAITPHERLRLRCILDAIVAELYGLEYDDFAWILSDAPNNPKGFWRVDKEKPKELRHTTLALAAFKRLKEAGLEAFCQEDWQFLPEIGAQLGPRFTAWQEQGTAAESWAECKEHAQRLKEIPIPLSEKSSEVGEDGKNGKGKTTQQAQLDLWST